MSLPYYPILFVSANTWRYIKGMLWEWSALGSDNKGCIVCRKQKSNKAKSDLIF